MNCPRCNQKNSKDTNYCGKCGMPLKADEMTAVYDPDTLKFLLQEVSMGTIIADRYEVIEELGRGGMGAVYKVFDKKIKEKIALKLIRPEIALNQHTIERFQNELKIARKIIHKNVCRMYDLGEDKKLHFITMEYISGQDLKKMIRMTKQLNVGTAVAITKQICEGLTESHNLGVIHRDLKPQNIMIDNDGNVRIMDFGIARSLNTHGVTATGVLIGTPEYMAPEQAEAKETDHRTDIYALGTILYEMVTGETPFSGDTPISIAIKHKQEDPRDPKEINAQIPDDLSHVILKCLEKDKEKRYQNAKALLNDLSKIEQGIPTLERVIPKRKSDTSKEITVTFSLKKILIPAVVVLMAAALGIAAWQMFFKQDRGTSFGGAIQSKETGVISTKRENISSPRDKQRPEFKVVPDHRATERPFDIKVDVPKSIEGISAIVKGLTPKDEKEYGEAQVVLEYLKMGASGLLLAVPPQYLDKITEYVDYLEKTSEGKILFKENWEALSENVKKAQESTKKGKSEEAQKHFKLAQKEMSYFLRRMETKNETDRFRLSAREREKAVPTEKPTKGENLMYSLGSSVIKDADKSYSNKDFSKAKIQYALGGEILSLSSQCEDESSCSRLLLKVLSEKKANAQRNKAKRLSPDQFKEAEKLETQGHQNLRKKEYKKAAEYFVKSAIQYEEAEQAALLTQQESDSR